MGALTMKDATTECADLFETWFAGDFVGKMGNAPGTDWVRLLSGATTRFFEGVFAGCATSGRMRKFDCGNLQTRRPYLLFVWG
jgi:hypothetical protein